MGREWWPLWWGLKSNPGATTTGGPKLDSYKLDTVDAFDGIEELVDEIKTGQVQALRADLARRGVKDMH